MRAAGAWRALALAVALALGGPAAVAGDVPAPPPGPAETYGPLFVAVQSARIFPDGKTFVDAVPRAAPAAILDAYAKEKPAGPEALKAFVLKYFTLPDDAPAPAPRTMRAHIRALWGQLARPPLDPPTGSSALALPAPYVVPGGRFREIYYWDSYFTMLGLKADGRQDLVDAMLENFTSLVERYGFVPNGTRTYYLSRSQPPFLAAMAMLSPSSDPAVEARRTAALRAEHAFWMRGEGCLPKSGAGECEHVVRLADGSILNRYWDMRDTPRDESYAEDVQTSYQSARRRQVTWRDLRAGAESGWDFSSRWMIVPSHLGSINTTRIVPIDLNSLLWQLETEIAARCGRTGNDMCQRAFIARADARAAAIRKHLWMADEGRFGDLDLYIQRPTRVLSAATLYPLFVGLASEEEAKAVARTTRAKLLAPGGLRTTLNRTGQQWDAPNGWAPLQWIAIDGLERYGEHDLARDIAGRWLAMVQRNWLESGKLLEKYDIEEVRPGGGGEYPTQDGFGWTNGVASALLERYPNMTDNKLHAQ